MNKLRIILKRVWYYDGEIEYKTIDLECPNDVVRFLETKDASGSIVGMEVVKEDDLPNER